MILKDRLGPDILRMKGHVSDVLQRARARLKVSSLSLIWNSFLTKLPMFVSRLNENNGGFEKILPISGSL